MEKRFNILLGVINIAGFLGALACVIIADLFYLGTQESMEQTLRSGAWSYALLRAAAGQFCVLVWAGGLHLLISVLHWLRRGQQLPRPPFFWPTPLLLSLLNVLLVGLLYLS